MTSTPLCETMLHGRDSSSRSRLMCLGPLARSSRRQSRSFPNILRIGVALRAQRDGEEKLRAVLDAFRKELAVKEHVTDAGCLRLFTVNEAVAVLLAQRLEGAGELLVFWWRLTFPFLIFLLVRRLLARGLG